MMRENKLDWGKWDRGRSVLDGWIIAGGRYVCEMGEGREESQGPIPVELIQATGRDEHDEKHDIQWHRE